jgi:hypothetical protein
LPAVAAIAVQLPTGVGPVLLSVQVVVVNELLELADELVQVATGVADVFTGVHVVAR